MAQQRRRSGRTTAAAATARALAGVAVAALVLAGCSDDEKPAPTSSGDDAVVTTAPTAADRLEQARGVLTEAGSVHLKMTGSNLPENIDAYVINADGSGTMTPPAFTGVVTAKVKGIQADVPTVAVDGQLYVKLPFTPGYISTSPQDLGVPDPARLFAVDEGLVSLLTKTTGPAFGEQKRAGREVVQEVSGTLPGQTIVDLLYTGDKNATFDVVYGLVEESWQVRTVTITGPFYPPTESTYAITLDQYGVPVTVTAP